MRISPEYIDKFRKLATDYLAPLGYTLADCKLGVDAWTIAHNSGITELCYGNTAKDIPDMGVNDAHIQTALQSIFPNCVFRDAKRY